MTDHIVILYAGLLVACILKDQKRSDGVGRNTAQARPCLREGDTPSDLVS